MGFTPSFKPTAHHAPKKSAPAKTKVDTTAKTSAKTTPAPKFQSGDKTQWNSQANGKTTTKAGTVVTFVPRGSNAYESLSTKFGLTVPSDVANLSLRFNRAISRTPRYLVRVNATGESTHPAKRCRIAQIYAVPATVIERQNQVPAKKVTKRTSKRTAPKSTLVSSANLVPVGPFSHI